MQRLLLTRNIVHSVTSVLHQLLLQPLCLPETADYAWESADVGYLVSQ